MVQTVTTANFEEIVKNNETVLLDFWATWCGPCQMQGPIIDALAEKRQDVVFGKVNVDEEIARAQQFGVMSIPTLIIFKNGEIVQKAVGLQDEASVEQLLK